MARNFKHKRPAKPERDKMVFKVLHVLRGLTNKEVAEKSGLSPATISKWRTRRTRYPQTVSYEMALKAVKLHLTIVDSSGHEVE
jgi:transcriptional regulator with XRE-family HTH domain